MQRFKDIPHNIDNELKRLRDGRDELIQLALASSVESYRQNEAEIGEQYAAQIRALEADKNAFENETHDTI